MWAQHHPFKNNDHSCCISGYLQYMHVKSVLSDTKTVLTHLKCKKPMRNLKKIENIDESCGSKQRKTADTHF